MAKISMLSGLLLSAALVGCSDARIAIPGELQSSTEELKIAGMGGWQDGHFRVGNSEGRFSRRSTQTKLFDTFIRNAGSGSFDVAGPDFGGVAGGRCGFDEHDIDLGAAVISNGRLTYRCSFQRDGRPVTGGLMLAEVPNGNGPPAGRTRAGELRLDQLVVNIRPVHRARGGGLPAGMPLGYTFDVDGHQIGAVDLNGPAKTIYAPRQAGLHRDAVLMASLALSVFWDPGD
jgi:hypothetical protein